MRRCFNKKSFFKVPLVFISIVERWIKSGSWLYALRSWDNQCFGHLSHNINECILFVRLLRIAFTPMHISVQKCTYTVSYLPLGTEFSHYLRQRLQLLLLWLQGKQAWII